MKKILVLLLLQTLINSAAFPQSTPGELTLMFYNVENLFDTKDDPLTNDDEFTPQGDRRWTPRRLNKKLNDLAKVILSASGWDAPQLVALCEVENQYVLDRLRKNTPLQKLSYKTIHKDSPDFRGIDVAFLYNEDAFYPLQYQYFPLINPDGTELQTREILYISGVAGNADTIHLFVNHWPSRYSGLLESKDLRKLAAETLRKQVEVIQKIYKNPKIIVVGDFNDQPNDDSVLIHLGAAKAPDSADSLTNHKLYNLSYDWLNDKTGTLKFQSQWSVFDQIIVSGELLRRENGFYTKPEWAQIVKLPFLFEKDERYGGQRLKRTYYGFKYQGGFSDHLPVILKLRLIPD